MPESWFEQNETNIARASAIDERDHQVLLLLLEHKVLTTHQIASLHFRSLRRCQHRMRELKEMGLVSSFQVGRGFGEGRAPACWHLTKPGLVEIADAKDVRTSDLPWVPDSSYRIEQAPRPPAWESTRSSARSPRPPGASRATALPPGGPSTGSGRAPPRSSPTGSGGTCTRDGACEFYLEYDRATEAFGALSRKLEGYLRLAAGWTREQELTGFPNLLVLVPEEEREGEVASAFRSAVAGLHVSGSLASSFPLYVASEDPLTDLGVLGPVWKHLPTDGERLVARGTSSPAPRPLPSYTVSGALLHRRRSQPPGPHLPRLHHAPIPRPAAPTCPLSPRRGDAPTEAELPHPRTRDGEATEQGRELQRDGLDASREPVWTEDDASLRPLARALLALAEQLSQEEGP